MAFDEQGQADTIARKVRNLRALHTACSPSEVGFPPEDIIFDPNMLAVATGIEEHAEFASDFIEATRQIKARLPHAQCQRRRQSTCRFSFRGNDRVREAMHTRVPCTTRSGAASTWASSTPGSWRSYDGDRQPELRDACRGRDAQPHVRDATERPDAICRSLQR
jgi:cobalamin-dependent methionine synthase I